MIHERPTARFYRVSAGSNTAVVVDPSRLRASFPEVSVISGNGLSDTAISLSPVTVAESGGRDPYVLACDIVNVVDGKIFIVVIVVM